MRTVQEWREQAERGTSGDMVYDLITDMEDLERRIAELEHENTELQWYKQTYNDN